MSADAPDTAEVRNVFEQHIPSIASGIVTIRGIARDRGNRSVLAVSSSDPATDPVGSCVGLRGATIKSIVKELRGEFVDIVRWSDSAKEFLGNLFTPMRFYNISFDETSRQVIAVLKADSQLDPSKTVALKSRLFTQLTGYTLQFDMEH